MSVVTKADILWGFFFSMTDYNIIRTEKARNEKNRWIHDKATSDWPNKGIRQTGIKAAKYAILKAILGYM